MKKLVGCFCCTTVSEAKNKFLKIMKQIGIETNLSSFGISDKDIELIVKNGFNPQRVKNNPRKITESQLRALLEKIL